MINLQNVGLSLEKDSERNISWLNRMDRAKIKKERMKCIWNYLASLSSVILSLARILFHKLTFSSLISEKGALRDIMSNTVKSSIEAGLVSNFWTFGTVLYLSKFLQNKSPNFHGFFSLQFETVFYSKQSSIKEFIVCGHCQPLPR